MSGDDGYNLPPTLTDEDSAALIRHRQIMQSVTTLEHDLATAEARMCVLAANEVVHLQMIKLMLVSLVTVIGNTRAALLTVGPSDLAVIGQTLSDLREAAVRLADWIKDDVDRIKKP